MRIVFMGTPEFALPALEKLVENGYEMAVVTQPDRPVGRGRALAPPPVKERAQFHQRLIKMADGIRARGFGRNAHQVLR